MTIKQVFKYPIDVADHQEVEMPAGAQILCLQMQNGVPCIWALVDPEQPRVGRRIRLVGTGEPFPVENCFYFGTFQMLTGGCVFHAFEQPEQRE